MLEKTEEIIINKSRFVAYRYSLESLEEVKNILDLLRKEHKKATHVCYAYVYNKEQVSEKCSDDGEPNGTAGYPILNVIKKKNISNTLVVVVRYFGGIKLGAGGLTRAYTKSCASVMD
ncbi:MAG: YigZ family protein [Clostridiales bacterium]|nr:YigZ family protein [Clostridiales bacterium]